MAAVASRASAWISAVRSRATCKSCGVKSFSCALSATITAPCGLSITISPYCCIARPLMVLTASTYSVSDISPPPQLDTSTMQRPRSMKRIAITYLSGRPCTKCPATPPRRHAATANRAERRRRAWHCSGHAVGERDEVTHHVSISPLPLTSIEPRGSQTNSSLIKA